MVVSPKTQKPAGTGGGSVAIRGFLVQTLVALLDIAQAEPPFTEITLEPSLGNDQFDFVWSDAKGTHAVQVKSTINVFGKSDVENWARKLEAERSTEDCRLVLVGIIHPSLEKVRQVGNVAIEKKNLDIPAHIREAAHLLAAFLEAINANPGTASERKMVVKALVTELEIYAANSPKSRTLTREAFMKLLRQWITAAPRQDPKFDISRIIKYAPDKLIGREAETRLLCDAWAKVRKGESPRPHVLTFVALGGEGKTALVAKWAAGLSAKDWPGCETALAWSFYSQGTRDQATASSDTFLKEALTFFGDPVMAESAQGAFDKGRHLAHLVGEQRVLLILDGLEPLQYAPSSPTPGELKDQGIAALLKGLAAANRGLCVVTTRYSIPDLRAYWENNAREIELLRLSKEAGVALLKRLGVKGTQQQYEKLVEDVKGHALTLNLLGSYLRDAHAGDIRKRDLVKLEEADAEEQGGHAFHVMDAYVKWFEREGEKDKRARRALAVLRLMGLFDRPATADCIGALLEAPAIAHLTDALVGMSEAQRNVAFTRLESANLLTVHRDAAGTLLSLDAHPLLREYFAQQLRMQHPEAWRAAHRRLYEHLCATTTDKKPNPTLEDLQPLYQAVAHGCQAGMQREARTKVYRDRILRGTESDGFYSTKKLGALGSDLGAIACFFEQPWRRVSPSLTDADQAWLLNEAAFTLRALGRLTEALEPMRVSGEMIVKVEQWNGAARSYSNLSELEMALGDVAGAVGDADQSVTYADRSGNAFLRMVNRTTHADALHHAGRRAEAQERFIEAEGMQAKRQPPYPLLYSLPSFRYCDLLLAAPERAAWQVICSGGQRPPEDAVAHRATLQSVSQRAAQTLKWVTTQNWLLDIALDHLTLGRAGLYRAILEESEIHNFTRRSSGGFTRRPSGGPQSAIEKAVDGLRRAGQQDYLPRGLLTRAWLRFLTGARTGPESAQRDLDEAWEISERGAMPLFLADIHLHRARLFQDPDALKEAAAMINETGYHRRDEEVEDAKQALGV